MNNATVAAWMQLVGSELHESLSAKPVPALKRSFKHFALRSMSMAVQVLLAWWRDQLREDSAFCREGKGFAPGTGSQAFWEMPIPRTARTLV